MNRRDFIKKCSVLPLAVPFISLNLSDRKRSSSSLFTTEELRTWSKMNGFYYLEDSDIWIDKSKQKMTTFEGKNYWICKRYPFLHKNDPDKWYECLRWDALDYKYRYKYFFMYDIVETTLPFQKEQGEFYSMVICGFLYRQFPLRNKEKIKRVYDIKDHCWLKPITDHWLYVGFEKV